MNSMTALPQETSIRIMRFTFLNPAVVAAVCVLSGCEAMEGALFKPAPPIEVGKPAREATQKPADRQTAAIEAPARPGVKPVRPPSVPGVDPKTLIGKNQTEAQDVLGPPNVVRNAPPATIWQYSTDGCTLDVFFYMDLGSNSLRALAYDAKLPEAAASEQAIAQCVGLVQVTNRARGR
jgi:hypothetical protein